jgi:hypothetical protein
VTRTGAPNKYYAIRVDPKKNCLYLTLIGFWRNRSVVPNYIDDKYGAAFGRVARGTGIEVLRTPYRAPRANAICERFIGSLRRECLDHFLILNERHLHRIVKEYQRYFNQARPHQGIEQRIPCQPERLELPPVRGKIASRPVLRGLHHDFFWQAAENGNRVTSHHPTYYH